MEETEEEYSVPGGWPELMVDLRQNDVSLVIVSIRQFLENGYDSGELPNGSMLIGDAVTHWNRVPDNVNTGVTAHIRLVCTGR